MNYKKGMQRIQKSWPQVPHALSFQLYIAVKCLNHWYPIGEIYFDKENDVSAAVFFKSNKPKKTTKYEC